MLTRLVFAAAFLILAFTFLAGTASAQSCVVNNVAGLDGLPNGTLVICPSGTATAGGAPLAIPPGTLINNKTPDSPGLGNTSFPTSAGFFSFNETIVLAAAGAGGGAGPGDEANITNAGQNIFSYGHLDNAGPNLPWSGSYPISQSLPDAISDNLLENFIQLAIAQEKLAALRESEAALNDSVPNFFQRLATLVVPVNPFGEQDDPGNDGDTTIQVTVTNEIAETEENIKQIKTIIELLGGDPENNPFDFSEFAHGIGGMVPYTDPAAQQRGGNAASRAIEQDFSQNFALAQGGFENAHLMRGETVDLWTRLKFSLIDGAAGFDGETFHGQLGAVRSVSDTIDLGVFVALFAGDIDSGSLATDMQALGLGAGAYVKARIGERTNASLVFDYERSDNDISIAGATGSFDRDRFELNASIDDTIFIGDVRVSRTANISWERSDREGYTNSAAVFVPGRVDDVVTATGALNFSRTIISDLPNVLTVTPSLGLALNYHIEQVDDITFANGSQLEFSTFTSDVNAGVSLLLVNGGTLSLAGGVAGLGGDVLAYSATARFSVPLP